MAFILRTCIGTYIPETAHITPTPKPVAQTPKKTRVPLSAVPNQAEPTKVNESPLNPQAPVGEPVKISADSESIPDVSVCATANFPLEAKEYVRAAMVTVRLVVDKNGTVRSVTPLSVEFETEPPDEVIPQMRKLFSKAGSNSFSGKRCPKHIVNGQAVDYAMEVPLRYALK